MCTRTTFRHTAVRPFKNVLVSSWVEGGSEGGQAAAAPMQQLIAPYSGGAIAEYFMDLGYDCLLIYDELLKHSIAHREISRRLRRTAGRDAYPTDAFYMHARRLERAACTKKGGSIITALPIMESQSGDVTSYIATNVTWPTRPNFARSGRRRLFDFSSPYYLLYTLPTTYHLLPTTYQLPPTT